MALERDDETVGIDFRAEFQKLNAEVINERVNPDLFQGSSPTSFPLLFEPP